MDAIYGYLKESPDADMAFSYFEDFIANSTSKSTIFELLVSFRVVGEILFGLFSQSHPLSRFLINNTELIYWLMEANTLGKTISKDEFLQEIIAQLKRQSSADGMEYVLRIQRKKHLLRIAVREIIGACSFRETMEELSDLASALIEGALLIAHNRMKRYETRLYTGFCVIGMGKLGNRELNFSSDIDLLFVHRENEPSSYHNRLAALLINALSKNSAGGIVWRVDMRLRPGGETSALSLSVEEYENYYATFGQTWEKMALTKARPVAGDMQLGKEFIETIEPFVYRKSLDIEYISEIRSMMFKIRKHTKKVAPSQLIPPHKRDIKKGEGGIREIEFIVNYFQLIYGGKDPSLKHIGTLEGLDIIAKRGYLEEEKCQVLKDAYLFLRKIEHKLQLLDERQTQTLPASPDELRKLSLKLSLTMNEFIERYISQTEKVHEIFNSIFIENSRLPVFTTQEDLESYLEGEGIGDAQRKAALIKDVARKFLAKEIKKSLIEELLDYVVNSVPERLLEQTLNGISVIDPAYTTLLFENRTLFSVFLKLLCVGMGQIIARNPEVLESLGSEALFEPTKSGYEKTAVLGAFLFLSDPLNFRSTIITRFAINYINHVAASIDPSENLSIIALGKLATGELFIGSDLDLVLVCDKNPFESIKIAQQLIKQLKTIYEVDLRLRPFGEKGSLVVDFAYLKEYFKKTARDWEKQAYQKSKIIRGGLCKPLQEAISRFVSEQPPSKQHIAQMKKRIEEAKAKGFEIKSMPGGLTDIEFLAQAICFDNGCIEIGASTLKLLDKIENLSITKTDRLKEAWKLFSAVLNAHRLLKPGSQIEEFDSLEYLLNIENLKERLETTRKEVRIAFEGYFS